MTTSDFQNSLGNDLPMDESGKMIKQWCISYTAWITPKKLLDAEHPTLSAYFIAQTPEEAVAKLLNEMSACKIDIVGNPRYCPLTFDEYMNS